MSCLFPYIRELNLFKPKDNTEVDEEKRRSNIIATRVFLILLVCCIIGLALGFRLTKQTTQITLNNPRKDQFETLPVDAQCPCSDLTFSYDTFTALEATFHQVCSSDFISDRWIKILFNSSNWNSFQIGDIRFTGTALFQALAGLCYLSNKSVEDNLISFHRTSFISAQALSRDVFESTIRALIEQFQSTMPNAFQAQFNLVNTMVFGNQLISGFRTNTAAYYNRFTGSQSLVQDDSASYTPTNDTICMCFDKYYCRITSGIYPPFVDDIDVFGVWNQELIEVEIPGLFTGCMPMNSLLLSTLECFYNQSCINMILSYLSSNDSFEAITILENSTFQLNSTVQSIVDVLMVEQWIKNISYEKYYDQCAPISCTYSKVEQHNFMFILTKVIGLLSGLILVLRLIIPPLVHFIRNKLNKENPPAPRIPLKIRVRQLVRRLKTTLVELNLFENKTRNHRHIRYQRTGSRLYIVALLLSFIIIVLYSSTTKELYRQTIINPTNSQYKDLRNIYGDDDVLCSCTTISVPLKTFILLEPTYHQICSSFFISSGWIDYLAFDLDWYYHINPTQRLDLANEFRLLNLTCQYVNETVQNALFILHETQFVSSQIIEEIIFTLEINSLITNWKSDTINQFQLGLDLIRATTHGNKLLNHYFNNELQVLHNGQVNLKPELYSNCSCDLFDSCHMPVPIGAVDMHGTDSKYIINFTMNHFYMGCFPFEALLQSTLECFYNQTCVNEIQRHLISSTEANYKYDDYLHNPYNYYYYNYYYDYFMLRPDIPILNTTNQWPNETTETIESIIYRLMINEWLLNISFDSYYNSCAPSSCVVEYMSRNHILVIITTIISIMGGLSTGLKIVTLICVRLTEQIFQDRFYRVVKQIIQNLLRCRNKEQITNRIHFLILVILLCLFYLFSFTPSYVKTNLITKPSLSTYQDLSRRFPDSLECPCSKLSFNYETFLSIEPHFHPICSSHFITNDWILYIYNDQPSFLEFNYTDFKRTAVGQYQLLSSLCQLSQKTVQDAVEQLGTTDYIGAQLIPSNVLTQRIQTMTNDFKLDTPRLFLRTLDIIRQITESNNIMTMYSSNWIYPDIDPPRHAAYVHLTTEPVTYEECNCAVSSKCIQSSGNMMAGCYPLEALLQSTLECFYDQQCIDSRGIFQALNSSLISTYFPLNSTIETILQELMVEEYLVNLTYENYFDQCALSSCTYFYIGREDTIDVITTLIGLYGGLAIISEWLAMLIVKFILTRNPQILPQIE